MKTVDVPRLPTKEIKRANVPRGDTEKGQSRFRPNGKNLENGSHVPAEKMHRGKN